MDGMPDLEKMIKSLSENRELMELLRTMRPENGAGANDAADSAPSSASDGVASSGDRAVPADKVPELMSALSSMMKGDDKGVSRSTENRNRLLSALKPYVGDSRREMIDKIMSLSKITGMLDLISGEKR